MDAKHTMALGQVQETLLIPLYGRAVETGKKHGVLRDPKAVEIVAAIDYDFSRFDGKPSLFGSVLRTAVFDEWVRAFLAEHPDGTVVEIGTGLNTRFDRLDNGRVRWIDLDLPDSIELRRKFFAESERCRMLSASVLDEGWIEEVKGGPGPYFLVAEAVLLYLSEPEVRHAVALITRHFPGARLAFDTCGRWIIDNQHRHDVMKTMSARMTWACDDPREIAQWGRGLRLADCRTFGRLPRGVSSRLPLPYRLLMPVMTRLAPKRLGRYRLNLFEIGASRTAASQVDVGTDSA